MCILRYVPTMLPSRSKTTAVLWYSPAARRSKSEATTTTLCLRAAARERLRRRAGDRLGEREQRRVFLLAEVLRAEELLQAHDRGAALGGLPDARDRFLEVALRLDVAGHLDETDDGLAGRGASERRTFPLPRPQCSVNAVTRSKAHGARRGRQRVRRGRAVPIARASGPTARPRRRWSPACSRRSP